jgi:hypothetical protein
MGVEPDLPLPESATESSIPARRLEGALVSAIVHCAVLLVLALLAIPASSTVFDSNVLVLGPESNASETLFTLDSDEATFESETTFAELQSVEATVPLVTSANVVASKEPVTSDWVTSVVEQPVDMDIGGDSGKDGDAVFFGTSASGRDFVFILDCSGSMRARGNQRFERAREELVSSISKLREDQRFYVFLFNWSTFAMFGADDPGTLVPANGENVTKLRAWLYTISPDSGTDPRRALIGSVRMEPDAIFLLSDGQFNKPATSNPLLGWDAGPTSVFDIFSGPHSSKVQVNTIAFEDQVAAVGMQKLAAKTNGQFRFVAAPGQEMLGQEMFGDIETTVDRDALPESPAEKLELAQKVLLIRRAEKLVAKSRGKDAANLVEAIDASQLPTDLKRRVERIRDSAPRPASGKP